MDLTALTTTINGALTDVQTVAVAVLAVLAGVFAIRKIMQMVNRG